METDEAPISVLACQSFQSTSIKFGEVNPLDTHRIGFCRNISTLSLKFLRPVVLDELLFLPQLQKLEKMILSAEYLNNANNVNYFEQILEFQFPTLTFLEIHGNVCGQDINEVLLSFSTCFTNLKRLCLTDLGIVPSNIFAHLSKLKLLERIDISGEHWN